MGRAVWIVGVALGSLVLPAEVRADLVTYTFLGTDATSGAVVTGSLSYSTDAAITSSLPAPRADNFFGNVKGNLSMTFAGKTYSSNAVSALFRPGDLLLYSDKLEVDLAINTLNISALPGKLSLSTQFASSFWIGVAPLPPGPGKTAPAFESLIAEGTITALDVVSVAEVAPEPGALTLVALGVSALALGAARRGRGIRRARITG
jgi:hypothetical protein